MQAQKNTRNIHTIRIHYTNEFRPLCFGFRFSCYYVTMSLYCCTLCPHVSLCSMSSCATSTLVPRPHVPRDSCYPRPRSPRGPRFTMPHVSMYTTVSCATAPFSTISCATVPCYGVRAIVSVLQSPVLFLGINVFFVCPRILPVSLFLSYMSPEYPVSLCHNYPMSPCTHVSIFVVFRLLPLA